MITIIGGGFTGLSAAYFLHRAGKDVTIFEKSRSLGGTRTTHHIAYRTVDIGEPYIDLSSLTSDKTESSARELLRALLAERGALPRLKSAPNQVFEFDGRTSGSAKAVSKPDWYYLEAGFKSFADALAKGITVRTHSRISHIIPDGKKMKVNNQRGEKYETQTIVFAIPAAEAAKLLADFTEDSRTAKKLCSQLGEVKYSPTVTAIFGASRLKLKHSFSTMYSTDPSAPINTLTREQKKRKQGVRRGESMLVMRLGTEVSAEQLSKNDSETLAAIERIFEEALDTPLSEIMYHEILRNPCGVLRSTPFKEGDVQKVKIEGTNIYCTGDYVAGSSSFAKAIWAGKMLADEILGEDSFIYIAKPAREQEVPADEHWLPLEPPRKHPAKPKQQRKQKNSKTQERKRKEYQRKKKQMKRLAKQRRMGPPRGRWQGGGRGPGGPPRGYDNRRGGYAPRQWGPPQGGGYDRGGGGYQRGGGYDRGGGGYQRGGGYDRGGGGYQRGGGYDRGGGGYQRGGGGYDRGGGGYQRGGGYDRGGYDRGGDRPYSRPSGGYRDDRYNRDNRDDRFNRDQDNRFNDDRYNRGSGGYQGGSFRQRRTPPIPSASNPDEE